jgi:hypothetical protein
MPCRSCRAPPVSTRQLRHRWRAWFWLERIALCGRRVRDVCRRSVTGQCNRRWQAFLAGVIRSCLTCRCSLRRRHRHGGRLRECGRRLRQHPLGSVVRRRHGDVNPLLANRASPFLACQVVRHGQLVAARAEETNGHVGEVRVRKDRHLSYYHRAEPLASGRMPRLLGQFERLSADEHRTSNTEHPTSKYSRSMLDVRCWMLDVRP